MASYKRCAFCKRAFHQPVGRFHGVKFLCDICLSKGYIFGKEIKNYPRTDELEILDNGNKLVKKVRLYSIK